MLIIIRNDHEYGPYDERDVAGFVEEGKLLMNDRARDIATGQEDTVKTMLLQRGIRPRVKNNGTLFN